MALRKTAEEKAQREAIRAQREREAEQKQLAQARKELRDEFFGTPAGQARLAFERGDHVFQYSLNVMSQKAIIVAMVGSNVAQKTADPSVILNSVCAEGWELVNGSFVFVETGQQSRDKFMSSGQNVAVSGATVGYYLFKRREANRAPELVEPWNQEWAPSPSLDGEERQAYLERLGGSSSTEARRAAVERLGSPPSDSEQ